MFLLHDGVRIAFSVGINGMWSANA